MNKATKLIPFFIIIWFFTHLFTHAQGYFGTVYTPPTSLPPSLPPPNKQLSQADEDLYVKSPEEFPVNSSVSLTPNPPLSNLKAWATFSCDLTSWDQKEIIEKDIVFFSVGGFEDGNPLLSFDLDEVSLSSHATQFYFKVSQTHKIDSRFVFSIRLPVPTAAPAEGEGEEETEPQSHRFRIQGQLKSFYTDLNKYFLILTSVDMDSRRKKHTIKRLPLECSYKIL